MACNDVEWKQVGAGFNLGGTSRNVLCCPLFLPQMMGTLELRFCPRTENHSFRHSPLSGGARSKSMKSNRTFM